MTTPAAFAATTAAPASSLPGGGSETAADTTEDPHSPDPIPVPTAAAVGTASAAGLVPSGDPLVLPLAFAGGALIALLALLVPLVTVAMDRNDHAGAFEALPAGRQAP